ncbi:MAG: hypothetical protein J6C05_10550 [Prevotella sp.]|nr:hypothetical protein [Prevotella sp.]
MRTTAKQRQFIINCDVENIVSILHNEYGIPLVEAFSKVYNSQLYDTLTNTRNGLFIQSPLYQFEYLKEELGL